MPGGIATRNTITAAPAARSAAVWPSPQKAPSRHDTRTRRCSLTRLPTAATWSGSSACAAPSVNPSVSAAPREASVAWQRGVGAAGP